MYVKNPLACSNPTYQREISQNFLFFHSQSSNFPIKSLNRTLLLTTDTLPCHFSVPLHIQLQKQMKIYCCFKHLLI